MNNTVYIIKKWYEHLTTDENHICIVDDEKEYKRIDVEILSGKIYNYLINNNIGKEDTVLIEVKRSALIFIIMLGIVKAGACFAVVEENRAKDRTEFIKNNSKNRMVINDEKIELIKSYEYKKGFKETHDNDAAYIIYTSGTTGFPKGILHEYGSFKRIYETDFDDEGKQKTDIDTKFAFLSRFDNIPAIMTFSLLLYSGGKVHILNSSIVKNPEKIVLYFNKNKITHTFLPTIIVKYIGNNLNKEIKYVYTGADDARNISISNGKLLNCYLMSEAGCFLTQYFIEKPMEICPVGKAKKGVELKINDDGELLYKYQYCRGYIGDSALNEDTFVDGWYHTSDIAFIDEDGNYVIKGRKTDMLKINGHRIEPLEIEKNANKIFCCDTVVKCQEVNNRKIIVLYYTKENADINNLKMKLKGKLPVYMMPNVFSYIKNIPYTESGKIDRKKLVFLEKNDLYIEPKTDIEKKVCKAIEKTLNIERVGLNDDIFSLGVNSIDIIEILNEVNIDSFKEKHFYLGGSVKNVIDNYLKENTKDDMSILEKEEEGRKHTYCLLYSGKIFYNLEKQINKDNPLLYIKKAFKLKETIDVEKLKNTINKMLKSSSTFQVEIKYDEKKEPYYIFNPSLYKEIEIEKVREDEIEGILKNLYKGLKPLNGRHFCIRLLKTEKNTYLAFCIHHIFTDGEGMKLILKDIMNMYLDKGECNNHFFAWLYDQKIEENRNENIEKAKRLKKYFDDIRWDGFITDNKKEKVSYNEKIFSTDINIKTLKEYLRENALNKGAFLSAAMILAECIVSNKNNVIHNILYSNRNSNSNHAGLEMKMLYIGVTMDKYKTLSEYVNDINEKYKNILSAPSMTNYIYDKFSLSNLFLSDLNDIDEIPEKYKNLIEEVPTFNTGSFDFGTPISLKVNYFHNINDIIYSTIYFDEYEVSNERMDAYIGFLKESLHAIINKDETWFQNLKASHFIKKK